MCKGTGWVIARGSEPDAEPDAQWPCSACCGTGEEPPDLEAPCATEDDNGEEPVFGFTFPTSERAVFVCDVYGIYTYVFSQWPAIHPTQGQLEGQLTLYDAIVSAWHD